MNNILTFEPIFIHVIWGGNRIAEFKGLPSRGNDVGESWELSAMPGHESVVAAGEYKGKTLGSLVADFGNDIMGARLMTEYDGKFPLLIKFIDSRHDLSIQVHPDDEMGRRVENKCGKTEMWYSIAPLDDAYLYVGFKDKESPESLKAKIGDSAIVECLNKYYTRPGDVFFLPSGSIHAIGHGNFVVEIQQASDVTYRIFDYNRTGADGKPRELHIDKAVEAVKFDNSRLSGPRNIHPVINEPTELVDCNYFHTDLIEIDGELRIDLSARDSFTALISISGETTVEGDNNEVLSIMQGRTILIPASMDSIKLSGKGSLISVYVP